MFTLGNNHRNNPIRHYCWTSSSSPSSSLLREKARRQERRCPRAQSLVSSDTCCHSWNVYRLVHGGQRIGLVDFDLVVPLTVWFCLSRCKVGGNGKAVGQDGGKLETSKMKSTKRSLWPPWSPCTCNLCLVAFQKSHQWQKDGPVAHKTQSRGIESKSRSPPPPMNQALTHSLTQRRILRVLRKNWRDSTSIHYILK